MPTPSARLSLTLLAIAALLAGCARPYATPAYDSSPPAKPGDIAFHGIVDELGAQPLDVLLVHGMCTHDEKWAKESVESLYKAAGGGPDTVNLKASVVQDTDIQLFQQTLTTSYGQLRANAIVWSPLTTPLKKQLCFDQTVKLDEKDNKNAYCKTPEETKPYPYARAGSLNRMLKDEILDDCLADAMAYQGQSREEMSARVQRAILVALATSGGTGEAGQRQQAMVAALEATASPLIIVTDSLGSKVTFDAIWKLSEDAATQRAVQRTLDRTTQIFMRANQLPILALADQAIEPRLTKKASAASGGAAASRQDPPRYPSDPLGALFNSRLFSARNGLRGQAPSIVAFTDPNDLLSYILVPSPHRERWGYPVIDVVVSNADTYIGLVERPDIAHTGYSGNRTVAEHIACGKPVSARCKR